MVGNASHQAGTSDTVSKAMRYVRLSFRCLHRSPGVCGGSKAAPHRLSALNTAIRPAMSHSLDREEAYDVVQTPPSAPQDAAHHNLCIRKLQLVSLSNTLSGYKDGCIGSAFSSNQFVISSTYTRILVASARIDRHERRT